MRDILFVIWSSGWVAVEAIVLVAVYRFLLRKDNPHTDLPRVLLAAVRAVLASGLLCVAQAPLAIALRFGTLSMLTAALLWIAFVPPILGLATLAFVTRRLPNKSRQLARIAAVVALLPAPVCAYASLIEPWWVELRRTDVVVPGMPADAEPIKVVVLADLQTNTYGEYERRVIELTRAEKPDLLLLPGDFFHCFWWQYDQRRTDFVEMLKALKLDCPVFACRGNIDPRGWTRQLFADAGVRLLLDEIEVVDIRGIRVAVAGGDYHGRRSSAPTIIHELRNLDVDLRLFMNHIPDAVLNATPQDQIDLMICGHTHGGQVVMPGFGPILTATDLPREVAAGGLHRVNRQPIYVSRGVGMERRNAPPLRFWCRPEISVLTFRTGAEQP